MKTKNVRRNQARRYLLKYPNSFNYKVPESAIRQWYYRDLSRGVKLARSVRRFRCMDCNVNTLKINEYYAVLDEVWKSVADRGMLCIDCLEKRLGYQLQAWHFLEAPINYVSASYSPKLAERFLGWTVELD